MVFRDQAHVLVAGRDQHPALQVMLFCKLDDRRHAVGVVGAGPWEAVLDVTRIARDRMVRQQPDRNALPAETTRDRDADMRAADNQRAGRWLLKRHECSRSAITGIGSAKAPRRPDARAIARLAARVTRRAA